MKNKVGIYTRVSTQEQASEGYSLGEQEERLKKYADAHDWIVYKVYTDPGQSGAKLNRPGLQDMIKDIKHGLIQKVIVYKLDRLSRKQKDTLYLIEDVFAPNNVDFISMTENFDTGSAFGRAMIGILSVFAQLEREQIKERMQIGLDARAKEGYFHGGGFDPIGYNYVNGELIMNGYESLQIRKIYDLYMSGIGITSIVKIMNDKGYIKRYGPWTDAAVKSVLFTPLYKGVITWKGEEYKGRHVPIFTEEEFDHLQQIQKERLEADPLKYQAPFKRTSLLGGLIWCGNCGARYHVKQNTVKRYKSTPIDKKALKYYTCYSRSKTSKKMIKDPTCRNPNFNTDKLDHIILAEVRKLAIDQEYLSSLIIPDNSDEDVDQHGIILDRIGEIDKQIEKLIELYQIGNIDFKMINDKITRLNDEKLTLETQMDEHEDSDRMSTEELSNIITTLPQILDYGTQEEIKVVVHSLINSIIIYPDHIDIHWKFQ